MAASHTRTTAFLVGVSLVLGASCTLNKQEAPPLTGPSELALSLALTAVPDSITQNGFAESVIGVEARDAAGRPARNVSLRGQIVVNGQPAAFGTLAPTTAVTDGNGFAKFVYTAPLPPPVTTLASTTVEIRVRPIGNNSASSWNRYVSIELVPPEFPQDSAPLAFFTFSPQDPGSGETIFFNASASQAAPGRSIVSYQWDFGKGTTGAGQTAQKAYNTPGTYVVTLVVTDSAGARGTAFQEVRVQ